MIRPGEVVGVLGICAACGCAVAGEHCASLVTDWHPRSDVVRMAMMRGWVIEQLKSRNGCYRVRVRDRDGQPVDVVIDPGTLRVLSVGEAELSDAAPFGAAPAGGCMAAIPGARTTDSPATGAGSTGADC